MRPTVRAIAAFLPLLAIAPVGLATPDPSPSLERTDDRTLLRIDGAIVQSTPDLIRDIQLTRIDSALTLRWLQLDPSGQMHSWYAYKRDAAALWSRPIDGDNSLLRLRWEEFDPTANAGHPIAHPIPAALIAGPENRAFIVQFVVPPFDAMRAELERTGALIQAFLRDTAYIIDIDSKSLPAIRNLPGVRAVIPFHPAFKCEPAILRGYLPTIGGNDSAARAEFRANWGKPYVHSLESFAKGQPASFWIQVHQSGLPMKQIVAHEIGTLKGSIQDLTPDDNLLRALLTQEQLVAILQLPEVAFVDPWGPAENDVDIARELSGANALESATNISGQGVRAEVIDGGLLASHLAFSNPGPAPTIRTNSSDTSHGTSTFGLVFGDGSSNPAGRGLLPSADAKFFYSYNTLAGFGGAASRLTVTTASVQQNNIVFQSNSWGSSLTTAYTTTSQAMDQIIFNTGLLICQSQSNDSTRLSRPEAWAKNILAVGAFNHNNNLNRADDIVGGASIGPAADGRVKPELSHFYDNVLCTTDSSDSAYTSDFGGTSAATPITCGLMGLIFQMWHEGRFPGFGLRESVFESRPSFTTARALAIHSAFRYNWNSVGPNATLNRNVQGWGTIDLANLLSLSTDPAGFYVLNESRPFLAGQSANYFFDVAGGGGGGGRLPSGNFGATLIFADPPGTVTSSQHSINDLSLRITTPDGTIYWGNNGLATGNSSTPGGISNKRDTVENVFLQSTPPGRYRIDVFADTLAQDANPRTPGIIDASFALIVSGGQRTPLRILTLDAARTGTCDAAGPSQAFSDSPTYTTVRQWLASPALFGGAGPIDRPTLLLPPVSTLSAENLAATDIVLLTGLASPLSVCELATLTQFLRQGGGLFAVYDNAAADLGLIFGASPGGPALASTFDPASSPILSGPYGPVASPFPGGSSRTFASLGSGTPLLTSAAEPIAAAFTLDLGRAVIINDAEWLASAPIPDCITAGPPSAPAQSFFLNSLASLAPSLPMSPTFGCCLRADFNGSGTLDSQDVFDYLNAWLSADPRADFNGSGLSTQDILDFLNAWLSATCA